MCDGAVISWVKKHGEPALTEISISTEGAQPMVGTGRIRKTDQKGLDFHQWVTRETLVRVPEGSPRNI